ncbi:phosphonatase-like hydrolase [bacterium]|nr:MAG: phosphonatase-like hydrolase [bacterium]
MKIELVVFDIAGTTVEDDDAVNDSFRAALNGAGLEVPYEVVNARMGFAKPYAIREILYEVQGSADDKQVETIHSDFVARMIDYYETTPKLREVPGARQTFDTLRAAGIKVALDTGFSRPITDIILRRLGWIEGVVDATVCPEEAGAGRPQPLMIRSLMAELGVSDPACVAKVGDTPSDMEEGANAGCSYIVGVTGGTHSREQLEIYPHTHIIGTVAELPALLLV